MANRVLLGRGTTARGGTSKYGLWVSKPTKNVLTCTDDELIFDMDKGGTADIKGILVDTSGQLATADSDVDKLEGLVTFADSVTFTDSVTEVKMSFNVGVGMSLYQDSGGNLSMGSGPFQAVITAVDY